MVTLGLVESTAACND